MITLISDNQLVWCRPGTVITESALQNARPFKVVPTNRFMFSVKKPVVLASELEDRRVHYEIHAGKLLQQIEQWLQGCEWITGAQVGALVLGGTHPPGSKWYMTYGVRFRHHSFGPWKPELFFSAKDGPLSKGVL